MYKFRLFASIKAINIDHILEFNKNTNTFLCANLTIFFLSLFVKPFNQFLNLYTLP